MILNVTGKTFTIQIEQPNRAGRNLMKQRRLRHRDFGCLRAQASGRNFPMSTNPLRREGGYWKPVLDYEHWESETPEADRHSAAHATTQALAEPSVRHDLCHSCGAEFVVDSPFCRMCGRAKDGSSRQARAKWYAADFYQLRRRLGLSVGAMVCLIAGLACIGAAVATGFIYTATTLVDWQAIQTWRSEWLIAAGVAFICGILLNGRKPTNI
jgi:hypothetical protein